MSKRNLLILAAILAAAVLAGLGVATVAVGTPAASGDRGSVAEATAQHRTQVNHYETPCDYRERMARGIPAYSVDSGKGLMSYVWAHLDENNMPDAELADYWDALDDCDANEPVAKWDFGSMILTHVEYLPMAS